MFTNMAGPGCRDDKSSEPGWDQAWPREEGSMTSCLSAAHPTHSTGAGGGWTKGTGGDLRAKKPSEEASGDSPRAHGPLSIPQHPWTCLLTASWAPAGQRRDSTFSPGRRQGDVLLSLWRKSWQPERD